MRRAALALAAAAAAAALAAALAAPGPAAPPGPGGGPAEPAPAEGVRTLRVGPELAECVGVGPRACMLVDEGRGWELFYGEILGFEHEPGFEHELRVRVTPVPDPPADGSSLRYELVEALGRSPAAP